MKYGFKKSMTLVFMALMLTVFMAVPAFAQTVSADVTFEEFGVERDSENIVFNTTGFTTLFDVPTGATHQYLDEPTVMDAIVQALDNLSEAVDVYWDTFSVPNGAYISEMFGLDTEELDSYYTGTPGQSYWKGNTWVLYVDEEEATLYASNILLNGVDDILFSYEYVEVYW